MNLYPNRHPDEKVKPKCVGVIEGDDGLFCAVHPTGCPEKVEPEVSSELATARNYLGMAIIIMERYNRRMAARLKRELKTLNAQVSK